MKYLIILLAGIAATYPTGVIASETDLSQGCDSLRWIGIRTANIDHCPKIGNWRSRTLFDSYDNLTNRRLEQFCVFERRNNPGKLPRFTKQRAPQSELPDDLNQLIELGLLENNIQQDCSVVDASAAPKLDVLEPLEKHLLYQSDRLSIAIPDKENYPVRLAILDTLPTAAIHPWNQRTRSPHGLTLALMAQKLLCDDSLRKCVADITSQLALAYTARTENEKTDEDERTERNKRKEDNGKHIFEPNYHLHKDTVKGGFFGSISDLALAIRREVAAWQTQSPDSKLILNLSLGWNSLIWGGAENDPIHFGADIQSVYYALADASCHGALVVAATGNQGSNEVRDQGPLLPAAWETLSAPSKDQCTQMTGTAMDRQSAENPLVYAVSGIDALGNPLNNSRTKGLSKLLAYGDHAIVNSAYNSSTQVLTGTSVATTLVSSTAAMVWSYRPDLTLHQLMYLIYRSGDKLNFSADFNGTAYGGLETKKVSMCSALKSACNYGMCPQPAACGWPKFEVVLSGTSISTDPPHDVHSLSGLAKCTLASDPGCEVKQLGSRSISPWVVPQPDSDPCPNCIYMDTIDSVIMEFNSSFSGTVSDAQLVVGSDVYTIPPFNLGDRIILEQVQPASPTDQLWLSVLINNSYRENIPLLNAN